MSDSAMGSSSYFGRPVSQTLWCQHWLGATVMLERQWDRPPVSRFSKQFGIGRTGVWLRLPQNKARNSWRWLIARWRGGSMLCLRWSLPKREAPDA